MNEGYRLRWYQLILADAVAIAVFFVLMWQYYGFGGRYLIITISAPVMAVVTSVGVAMWADGRSYRYINGPRWDTMDEGQRMYAASSMGIAVALSMLLVDFAIAAFLISYGVIWFLLLLFTGMGVLFIGLFRVYDGRKVGDRTFRPKTASAVWGTLMMVLFASVAVPVLMAEVYQGTDYVEVSLGEESLKVTAPLTDFTIDYSEISSVELVDDFDRGSRTSGYHDMTVSSGNYRNGSLGSYRLAAFDACDSCIVVKTVSDKYYAFNRATESETAELMAEILSRIS